MNECVLCGKTLCGCFSFLRHQKQELSLKPNSVEREMKKFGSFLKSQIFYSIRAVNDIFCDSPCGFVVRRSVLFPLISSFLFWARIIPFFHIERHTKDKQNPDDNIKRRHIIRKKGRRQVEPLNIDTNSYDDSESCDVGENIDFPSTSPSTEGNESLFRIHKCLNKLERRRREERKNCFLIIFKDFFILFFNIFSYAVFLFIIDGVIK